MQTLLVLIIMSLGRSIYAEVVTYIKTHGEAIQGAGLDIECGIETLVYGVVVYLSDYETFWSPENVVQICNHYGVCKNDIKMCTNCHFTATSSSVLIKISQLDSIHHQKYWACYTTGGYKRIFLNITIVPKTITWNIAPSVNKNLSEEEVTLNCSTDCASPKPDIAWYYSENKNNDIYYGYATHSDFQMSCKMNERIYTSALTLSKNTQWRGNEDKTVSFRCGITNYTGLRASLFSPYSMSIAFAVRVAHVTLLYSDGQVSNNSMITVKTWTYATLSCTPSVSRPPATVVWYVGKNEVQRSLNVKYTHLFVDNDHNSTVYCKAFNLQPETQAVESNRILALVTVEVTNVKLMIDDIHVADNGHITLSNGTDISLKCSPSASRPLATVVWYVGHKEVQRSTNVKYKLHVNENVHNCSVYCKAFNTQPESQAVESNRFLLNVTVQVAHISLMNGDLHVTNNSQVTVTNGTIGTLRCIASKSRPQPVIVWYVGQKEVQRGTNVYYTLPIYDSDNNSIIYCKAFNIQPESQAVASNILLLNVTDEEASVSIRDNDTCPDSREAIVVTSGVSKILSCVPSPIISISTVINWYIDDVQRKTSNTSLDFEFVPSDEDHNKQIFCTSINWKRKVTSKLYRLKVKVNSGITSLNTTTGKLVLFVNDKVSLVCETNLSRPAANVTWRGLIGTNISNVIRQADKELVWVTSTITFIPTKLDHNKVIQCEAAIEGQSSAATFSSTLEVWWPPSKPVIHQSHRFPWRENINNNHLTCNITDYGNPRAQITWNSLVGSPDPINSPIFALNNITYKLDGTEAYCQLDNEYTVRKGYNVTSDKKEIYIHFSPKTFLKSGHTFTISHGYMFNAFIPIYCKPTDIEGLNITRQDNENTKLKYKLIPSSVDVNIAGRNMTVEGYIVTLHLYEVTDNDHGVYALDISNSIGKLEWHFVLESTNLQYNSSTLRSVAVIGGIATIIMVGALIGTVYALFKKRCQNKTDSNEDKDSLYDKVIEINHKMLNSLHKMREMDDEKSLYETLSGYENNTNVYSSLEIESKDGQELSERHDGVHNIYETLAGDGNDAKLYGSLEIGGEDGQKMQCTEYI